LRGSARERRERERGSIMKDLTKIFRKFEIEEHEVAEMVYMYLVEYGDKEDYDLMENIYKTYLRG
jgi:hypothetical protein